MNQPPASESLDKAPGWATAGPQPAPPASRPSHVFTIDDQTRASSDLADAREGLEKQIKKLAETQRDQRELREDDTKAPQGAGENEAAKSQPKIIKSGELTVEVKDFAKASREADETIVKSGGYIADSRVQNLEGAAKRAIIKVRVVPEKFEALFAELKKLGNVLHERAGGQDVTAQYTDSEARIKNLQIAEERLQELIKTKTFMDKIQSLLEVERELTRVRGEIEGLQGQMRVWNDLLSLSTLTLTLQEPTRPVPGGNLAIEVRSLHESKAGLDAAVAKAGGQLLSGQVVKQGDGTLTGTYRLSVPFGGFASLAKEIKDLGRTEKEELQNQPFADRVPEGAERVPCYLNLYFFERGVQLPSGNLALEIETLDAAVQNLKAALVRHDGVAVSNQTFRRPDGGANANLTLQVKAGAFEKLVEELKLLGRVTQFSVGGESGDIRGGAAERPVQLAVVLSEKVKQIPSGEMSVEVGDFTETRTALSKLIADENLQVLASDSRQNSDGSWLGTFRLGIKADKMDSVVTKLEALGRVKNRNLKGLGLGDLSRVDPNVVGEVSVTFGEKPKLAPQEDGAFRLMLRDTFGGFLNSIGIIIRGLGWMVPWLAGLGLVYLLLRRATRTVPATPVAPAKPKESEGASTEDKKE
ncbi:MAG: DUF4349 domain-containing protein [Planctomycetota bacterium]|nr:DUF4349 domain-containing protein [Planctomycetota bacterium]